MPRDPECARERDPQGVRGPRCGSVPCWGILWLDRLGRTVPCTAALAFAPRSPPPCSGCSAGAVTPLRRDERQRAAGRRRWGLEPVPSDVRLLAAGLKGSEVRAAL